MCSPLLYLFLIRSNPSAMSMGYGELEASNDKQNVSKVQRKSISLKLKRDSHDETSELNFYCDML